jgi:hypothetical protein
MAESTLFCVEREFERVFLLHLNQQLNIYLSAGTLLLAEYLQTCNCVGIELIASINYASSAIFGFRHKIFCFLSQTECLIAHQFVR